MSMPDEISSAFSNILKGYDGVWIYSALSRPGGNPGKAVQENRLIGELALSPETIETIEHKIRSGGM